MDISIACSICSLLLVGIGILAFSGYGVVVEIKRFGGRFVVTIIVVTVVVVHGKVGGRGSLRHRFDHFWGDHRFGRRRQWRSTRRRWRVRLVVFPADVVDVVCQFVGRLGDGHAQLVPKSFSRGRLGSAHRFCASRGRGVETRRTRQTSSAFTAAASSKCIVDTVLHTALHRQLRQLVGIQQSFLLLRRHTTDNK